MTKFLLLLAITTPAFASVEHSRPGSAVLPQDRFPLVVPEPFPVGSTETASIELSVGKRTTTVRVTFGVCVCEDTGLYRYDYVVHNDSQWTLGFGWLALDRITGTDNMLVMLRPGEKRFMSVLHEKIPVRATAPCRILLWIDPAQDPAWAKDICEANADVGGPFFHELSGRVTGPVPLGTK